MINGASTVLINQLFLPIHIHFYIPFAPPTSPSMMQSTSRRLCATIAHQSNYHRIRLLSSRSTTTTTTTTTKQNSITPTTTSSSVHIFIKAGLPLVLFAIGSTWVLQSAIDGKNKERATSLGQVSVSERQAKMEREHTSMLETIQKVRTTDFDNTKRIERPEEVLERRRRERAQRNVWYRRWGRWIMGKEA